MASLVVVLMISLHAGRVSYHQGRIPGFYDWKSCAHLLQGLALCLLMPKYRRRQKAGLCAHNLLALVDKERNLALMDGECEKVLRDVPSADTEGRKKNQGFLRSNRGKDRESAEDVAVSVFVKDLKRHEFSELPNPSKKAMSRTSSLQRSVHNLNVESMLGDSALPLATVLGHHKSNVVSDDEYSDVGEDAISYEGTPLLSTSSPSSPIGDEDHCVISDGGATTACECCRSSTEDDAVVRLAEESIPMDVSCVLRKPVDDAIAAEKIRISDDPSKLSSDDEQLRDVIILLECYPLTKSEYMISHLRFFTCVILALGYPIYNFTKRMIRNRHEFSYSSYAMNTLDYLLGLLIGIGVLALLLVGGWLLQRVRRQKQTGAAPSARSFKNAETEKWATSADTEQESAYGKPVLDQIESSMAQRNVKDARSSQEEMKTENNVIARRKATENWYDYDSKYNSGSNHFFLHEPFLNRQPPFYQSYVNKKSRNYDDGTSDFDKSVAHRENAITFAMKAWRAEHVIFKPVLFGVSAILAVIYTAGMTMMIFNRVTIAASDGRLIEMGYD